MRDWPCQPLTLGPIQAGEMIDVKSNFKHSQFNSGRQTASGGQRLATQLGQPDKTYGSSLPAGVFVYMRAFVCVAFFLETASWTHGAICPILKGELEGATLLKEIWISVSPMISPPIIPNQTAT